MIEMTIGELVACTGSTLLSGSESATFAGVEIDSRKVGAGSAFVAFAGERVNGNRYVAAALEAGAAVAVVTEEPDGAALAAAARTGAALVRAAADDGEQFMLALAGRWRDKNPQWIVVGVTGSVGKTTTKEMLKCGIGATRRTHATHGNFNNLLGVPLTLFQADPEDEVLVVEMGMNATGEISRIARAAKPTVAVITNVGTSHIGILGSRENIARAKAEVTEGIVGARGIEPTLVLTAVDDYADFIEDAFARPRGIAVCRVGAQGSAVEATSVTLDEDGCAHVVLRVGETRLTGTLSLPGRAMVADLVSAMGAIAALGLPLEEAFRAICALATSHMRLEVRTREGAPRVIDDSYNASPASMASSLDVLCSLACEGRRVAVLGEMGELGAEGPRLHALVGAYAAAKPIDLLVLVGAELADEMADAALTMGFSADHLERFASAADAARVMVPVFDESDLVLVKASRAIGLDTFAKEVLR